MSLDPDLVILEKLNRIFRDVFGNDDLYISMTTAAPDVPGWDSLIHVTLVLRVERSFGVRFSSREVESLVCVGDLVRIIRSREA